MSTQSSRRFADGAVGRDLGSRELRPSRQSTKSVLESGVPLLGIPTTLQDSLMARLDRLASVRRVAQIGAAIGREFGYELLRAVSPSSR